LWGLALLLGTFGVVALYLAVKRTRSARRFGEVWLALEENPSILGGKMCAAVHAANGFPEDARASLYLVCSLRSGTKAFVSGYSMNLWQESRESSAAEGAIPVEFDLPEDLPESDPDIASRAKWCTWDLVVTVASTSATYHGQFAVPVFKRDTVARPGRND
jgi:hypothetical protein